VRLRLLVEVAELGVAVGMLGALDGLGVGLQAEALLAQQPGHRVRTDPVPGPGQLGGQPAGGQRGPAQRRARVPPAGGLHQRQQRCEQCRIGCGQRLAAAAGAAHPPQRRLPGFQLGDPLRDPRPRRPAGLGHRGDPTVAQRTRLPGQHQPLLPLVQMRQHRRELGPQRLHHIRLHRHYHIMTHEISNRVIIFGEP
jgi:hypothetical protein